MRGLLIASLIGLSVVVAGCGEKEEAKAPETSTYKAPETPKSAPIPEGTPMPKEGEILNKDIKLNVCKNDAANFGKDHKQLAQSCKKNLGKEVCEQYFTKAACE